MAVSRYSTPFSVSQPTGVLDVGLLDSTLGYKQARYDQGYLAVDNSIQQLNSLDLIKPEDIAYRNKKIAALTDQLNSYGNQDLSDIKITSRLVQEAESLKQDPILMSSLASTQNYRSLVKRYQLLKENPKLTHLYSSINEDHDMSIARDWLDGKTSTMSLSSPTFKVDVDKKASDLFKTLAIKKSTTVDGFHLVNNELRTANDLQTLGVGLINSDPEVTAQLRRNAEYLFRGENIQDTYVRASEDMGKDISNQLENLQLYETKLKDASLTKEQKASLSDGLDQLRTRIANAQHQKQLIDNKTLAGDFNPNEAKQLQFSRYASNWVKGVSQPFVVENRTLSSNQAGMFEQKRLDEAQQLKAKYEFTADQNDKDRQLTMRGQEITAATQMAKEGKTLDVNELRNTGRIVSMESNGLGTSTSLASGMISLPADAPEKDYDVIKDLSDKTDQLYQENRAMLTSGVIDIIKKTDPTLAGKLESIYKSNGDITQYKGEMSKGQIDILAQYDKLLDDANNPEKLKNNPALNAYGAIANQVVLNTMKANAYNSDLVKAQKEVFNDMWSKKEYKGTWNQFQADLRGDMAKAKPRNDISINQKVAEGMTPSFLGPRGKSSDLVSRINNTLRKSSLVNEFYTMKVIGEDDKQFNQGAGVNLMLEYANQTGIIVDGLNKSINGNRQQNKVYRDDIPDVGQIRVEGIIPNKNQVRVSVMTPDPESKSGKLIASQKGVMQLNPDQFKQLIGKNSDDQVKSVSPYLIDGTMQNKDGSPLYLNLNADIPDMIGNIKYRFYDKGNRNLGITVQIPVNGRLQEVHNPDIILSGENAHLQGRDLLIKAYKDAYLYEKRANPKATKEEVSKLALKNLQDNAFN